MTPLLAFFLIAFAWIAVLGIGYSLVLAFAWVYPKVRNAYIDMKIHRGMVEARKRGWI
jgi:hypothetical protein